MEPPIQTDFISMVVPMPVHLLHATGLNSDALVSLIVLMSEFQLLVTGRVPDVMVSVVALLPVRLRHDIGRITEW